MTEAVIIYKPVHWSMDWFLYDNGLHHERVKYQMEMFNQRDLDGNVSLNNVAQCSGYTVLLTL